MHKNKLFLMAAALALFASPVLAAEKSEDSVQACWQPAFEAMNADAVAQCYAPDAVLWLPNMPMMQGRDAIRKGYTEFFAAFTIKTMKLDEMGRTTRGDEATSWGSFTLTMVAKADGKGVIELGRYTDVSRKVDGKWMYVVDHASDDPPPAAATTPPEAVTPAK